MHRTAVNQLSTWEQLQGQAGRQLEQLTGFSWQ
jgi:hypothetical protein